MMALYDCASAPIALASGDGSAPGNGFGVQVYW